MCLTVLFLINLSLALTCDLSQVVFVIMSQTGRRHVTIAEETRENLSKKLIEDGVKEPLIFDLHNDWKSIAGGWTIFPLLEHLEKISGPETKV